MTLIDFMDAPQTVYAAHQAEEAAEAHRLASAADRVLAALLDGPKTNLDLIHVCQRISGRIFDLRKRGYQIVTEPIGPGVFRYTYIGRVRDDG